MLERDYTEEDIKENMGDHDFANDFADELLNVLNELKKLSADTAKDC